MNKIILKTAIKTLVAVIIALILAFGIASLGFPQNMAGLCAKYGNYKFATSYASLRYTYTHSVGDLDVCARYSILSGHDGNIEKFCGRLVNDCGFEELCKKQTTEKLNYRQYIYGNLSAAQYRRGEKDKAIATAKAAMLDNGFPAGNAFVYLTLAVQAKSDKETADKILVEIESFQHTETYEKVKNVLTGITA